MPVTEDARRGDAVRTFMRMAREAAENAVTLTYLTRWADHTEIVKMIAREKQRERHCVQQVLALTGKA